MIYYKNYDLADIKYFCEFDLEWKIEQWKGVIGYENQYLISDLGRVKTKDRIVSHFKDGRKLKSKILKQKTNVYLKVGLCKNSQSKSIGVHILVSMAFLNHTPCGFKLVVNHKNLIKLDNRVKNLEIITQRQNSNQKHLKKGSKYTGVHKQRHMWRASIWLDKKRVHLGMFTNEYDAHLAYENKLATLV